MVVLGVLLFFTAHPPNGAIKPSQSAVRCKRAADQRGRASRSGFSASSRSRRESAMVQRRGVLHFNNHQGLPLQPSQSLRDVPNPFQFSSHERSDVRDAFEQRR